jgi:cell fate regulator YaaT (PSP1 superfamily)
MAIMAVTFGQHGQLHYLDSGDQTYTVGDWVLYPTSYGPEVAQVAWVSDDPLQVADPDDPASLPLCDGHASADDRSRDRNNRSRAAAALITARELVSRHNLPMKLLAVDWIDRDPAAELLAAIYFQAVGRVDFSTLVPDLARTLQARVDLRQIGSRDATRLCGGVGSCGRTLCCCTWVAKFEPISLRLAHDQGLQTNPMGISGVCGKLKCCLSFEQSQYRDFAKIAPERGTMVTTPNGPGKVIGMAVPAEAVVVRHRDGQVSTCPLVAVTRVPITQRVTAPIVSVASAATTAATSAATTVFRGRPGPRESASESHPSEDPQPQEADVPAS